MLIFIFTKYLQNIITIVGDKNQKQKLSLFPWSSLIIGFTDLEASLYIGN